MLPLPVTLLIFILFLLFYYFYYRLENRDFYLKTSRIPSPKRYPIIGNSHLFIGKHKNIFKIVNQLREDFQQIVAIWMGPWLNVCIFSPRYVEIILKKSSNMDKSYHYKFLKPWLGDSILISSGVKFQRNRKIITQAFHVQNLKQYLAIFNRQADSLIEHLQQFVDRDQIDVYQILNRYTMHALLETTLGVDPSTMSPKDAQDYATSIADVGCCGFKRTQQPWFYPDWCFYFSKLKQRQDRALIVLNKFTNLVINQRRQEYETCKTSTNDRKRKSKFLDAFFANDQVDGYRFTAEEIKDEVMTIMFAGQDTTTTTMAFVLGLLGYHSDIQQRVVDELETILGDTARDIVYDDLQKMKYLECVIQETLRLFPPIPVIAKTLRQDVQLDDLVIPKNSTVIIPIMAIHRNPDVYTNPNEFNPDNFSLERNQERHPYSFIPFSENYRKCIGGKYATLIIKTFLAKILMRYEIRSSKPLKKYKLSVQTVLKRKDGHFVGIVNRKRSQSSCTSP